MQCTTTQGSAKFTSNLWAVLAFWISVISHGALTLMIGDRLLFSMVEKFATSLLEQLPNADLPMLTVFIDKEEHTIVLCWRSPVIMLEIAFTFSSSDTNGICREAHLRWEDNATTVGRGGRYWLTTQIFGLIRGLDGKVLQ